MDDFNEGNNFEDNYDDDNGSFIDDVYDVKDNAKNLKNEINKYNSKKENYSSLNDNGKAFRNKMRSSGSTGPKLSNSEVAVNGATQSGATVNVSGSVSGTAASGTTAGGAAAGGAATGEAAAGGAAAGGTAAGGAAAGGTAAGGAAAGGAAAGGAAAGGTAAGGAAAGGAAAGGAAAGGAAAAGLSATGIGAIVVAAVALLLALKKLANKIDKKIEELTGTDTKKMKKYLLLGVICLIIVLLCLLFANSATSYDDLNDLIKRREKRYGKSLIMFTDEEYNETINKDYDKDECYATILRGYLSNQNYTIFDGLDSNSIINDKSLSDKEKREKLLKLSTDEVEKYLKAGRENFNKIIWNTSSGYNTYNYQSSQSYSSEAAYQSGRANSVTLSSNSATIPGSIAQSDDNTYYWEIYKKYNANRSFYEIKDSNGKATGLFIPEDVIANEENKDEAAKYYVDLLDNYLQKWVVPYMMMIDSNDKEFVDRIMNEMFHRVDVNVYKLSKDKRKTKKSYYMKAVSYKKEHEYIIYDDDATKQPHVISTAKLIEEKTGLNTRDNPISSSTEVTKTKITENGRKGTKYKEVTTSVELDPSKSIAEENGAPMVKSIDVNRNISEYKAEAKVVNIESFYDIIREDYNVTPISESNPANTTTSASKEIDEKNGILTENYDETWYEELEQNGQTEKKSYSVSYYTDEQVKKLNRKISRVEWAQDYGDPNATTASISDVVNLSGESGGASSEITRHNKTYKVYNQGNFNGNIPGAGCGLTSTCMILSAYRQDLDLNPNGLAAQIGWTGPHSISQTAQDLKRYGVNCVQKIHSSYAGTQSVKSATYNDIKANLKAGRPVFILVYKCKYTSDAHYMDLIDIDDNNNVTILDSAGGNVKIDTLTNMVNYMYDNAYGESGYLLIKNDVNTQTGKKNNSSSQNDSGVSEENAKKINDMLKYAVSLKGKVAYVWGGGPHNSKKALESSGADCSGFVISLYRIFFSKKFDPVRPDIYTYCKKVNVDGLKGIDVFNGGASGTKWNNEIKSKIKPGDIVYTSGHFTMFAGDIMGDGKLYTISQGGGADGNTPGPTVEEASSYYTMFPILGICRFVGNAATLGNTSSSASVSNDRIFPVKTIREQKDAYDKYGEGKGYSYDDLYFAYYHIEEYYKEIEELNSHSTSGDDLSDGSGLGWPVDVKKYPGCKVINCFYGYTPAYGESHGGTDISAGGYVKIESGLHVGPEVIAAHDGKVVTATGNPSSDSDGYTYVEILADDGKMKTQYGHLSKILVKKGQKVKKGDVIGRMGTTGNSSGTHLHFAMFINGSRTDPMNYYILAKEGTKKAVDYSKIDKNTITHIPTGYVFYKEKGGASSQIVKFIMQWEYAGTPPMDASKTKYKIYKDSDQHNVIAYGLDLKTGGYASILKNAGYGTSEGDLVDKDFIDNLYLKQLNTNYRAGVIKRTQGLNLKDFQIDALTSRAYNCGEEGALGSRGGFSSFSAAYKKYWNDTDFNKSPDYNHPLYTNYMSTPITSDSGVQEGLIKRRKSEWKLFQTGVYDASH